ncbi:hypothetical protein [Streptomyces sp. NPDC058757]|uniref:hypothetical protein n=1 Tax=unclassified Streptomyces TaxID=2593676 RepID=UPI0036AB00C6
MRSILRATRLRARAGALAVIALLAVAAGPLGDIGWPTPAPGAGAVVAGDIGWPSPAPAGPVLAAGLAAQDDIGWPVPPKA